MSPTLLEEFVQNSERTFARKSNGADRREAMSEVIFLAGGLYLALRTAVSKGKEALGVNLPAGQATAAELKAQALKLSEVIEIAEGVKARAIAEGFTPGDEGPVGKALTALDTAWGEACALRQEVLQRLDHALGEAADGPRVLAAIEESKRAGASYVTAEEAFKAWSAGE
jgi:hypothetical protein